MKENGVNCVDIVNSHCRDIKTILIIEDSTVFQTLLKECIEERFEITCDIAPTEHEARELLDKKVYDLIIADIFLPDSSGNFIGYLIRKKYPIVIITGSATENEHQKLTANLIVDYVHKTDDITTKRHIINIINRLIKNKDLVVAICDDSKLSRSYVKSLLVIQNLAYIEFENGQEAYDSILVDELKVDLLITDVEMPLMGGLELVRKLRHFFDSYQLPILAFSSTADTALITRLLKTGANDYVNKPINNEEFVARVSITLEQSSLFLENQEMIAALKKASSTDFLTTLYNRTYFYQIINHIQAQSKRENLSYGIMMIDIDFFKKLNDNYGHEFGDKVLIDMAHILKTTARDSDIPCRWGGEEFVILAPNTSIEEMVRFAQRVRKTIEHTKIHFSGDDSLVPITISAGVAVSDATNVDKVDEVIKIADGRLYKAKEAGRNRVAYE